MRSPRLPEKTLRHGPNWHNPPIRKQVRNRYEKSTQTSAANISINQARLSSEIEELASISEAEPPVVTRIVFTEPDLKARAWLKKRCEAAGLSVRHDAIGNVFIRWQGSDPNAPAVGTGSHIDAIPNAGKYDGVVGVLGGLEAIRALQQAGFRPRHSIELLVFTAEEPTRFGIGCPGSRMLSGTLTPAAAQKLKDKDGLSFDEIRNAAGMNGDLTSVQLPRGYYKAFVELHIEQGPVLERERIPLGIVTNIAAPASLRITFEGSGGHAGGVLMPDRRDALCAASELILAIESAAKSSGAIDTVATVGMCDVFPGAINSIPSRVRISVDVRDTDLARRDASPALHRSCLRANFNQARRDHANGISQCRCSCGLRTRTHRRLGKILPGPQFQVQKNGQPRLPRFAFHVACRAHRNAVYPLP